MRGDRAHWDEIYRERGSEGVSWYESTPEQSLTLIKEAGVPFHAPIVDVGGGASRLAGRLLNAGYTDVTVADLSESALDLGRQQLYGQAERVSWVQVDLRFHDLGRVFELWHDRAMLHFMVEEEDLLGYVEALRRGLRPGGHLIVATFGPEGPKTCSGLPVRRYGAQDLERLLGSSFELVSARLVDHRTPAGAIQQFQYAHLRRAQG